MAVELQPTSTIFHTIILEQLKKQMIIGTALSQKRCGPLGDSTFPCPKPSSVLDDRQYGLPQDDTQALGSWLPKV